VAGGVAADFVVIGAGIVGLTVARELTRRHPGLRVVVLEKEPAPGRHASGRNSGVVHSGIYYAPGSLKASICAQGARDLTDYCQERGLPLMRTGKVLVPTRAEDGGLLAVLEERGRGNGVEVERLDEAGLRALEPEAGSATGEALRVPATAVISPLTVLEALAREVAAAGAELRCRGRLDAVDPDRRTLTWSGERIAYGHVVNCAGVHADTIAHRFGAGLRYAMLPFRGAYWRLDPASGIRVRHLIYPVPDLRVPFLGVHTTTSTEGDVYLGPTALPALGREHYQGLAGVTAGDAARIGLTLLRQAATGRDGFRRLAWNESRRVSRPGFAAAARALIPRLRSEHLLPSAKSGIRAQLFDRQEGRLVMDFLVERSPGATHVLNAVSPAFTCAFPFARLVVGDYVDHSSSAAVGASPEAVRTNR
jgi:(S)-2-hydroxyglutarate dehydrogenase